jgi:hypothetical protein
VWATAYLDWKKKRKSGHFSADRALVIEPDPAIGGGVQKFLKLILTSGALVVGFLALSTTAQSAPDPSSESALGLFAAEIKVGPNWDASKPPNEQEFFKEHSINLKRLRDAGHVVMGARYSDIGLIVFSARSAEEVRAFMSEDPSMEAGTFMYEVHVFNVFYPGMVQSKSKE